MSKELVHKVLHQLLEYHPHTGRFFWVRTMGQRAVKGTEAGFIKPHGRTAYRIIKLFGKQYKAHRLAWLFMTGKWPENLIDHIDRDGTNNRWKNLREATHSENSRNRRLQNNNKSGCAGVYWDADAKKWCAEIRIDLKIYRIGRYKNYDAAVNARKNMEELLGYTSGTQVCL